MTGVLTLDINQQCGKDGTECKCDNGSTSEFIAKNEQNVPVHGFIKVTHSIPGGGPFELSRTLANNDIVKATVTPGRSIGSPIEDVKELSVYYWNGNPSSPILIGITKKNETKATFYGKLARSQNWGPDQVNGLSELEALDHQNCQHNQAVPFDIRDSQSVYLPKDYKSQCIKSRSIDSTNPPPSPPESEYNVKAHKITDTYWKDTKIARVTLNGNPTNITFTRHDAIAEIRLYSYPGARDVPLMVEFKPRGGGTSTFFNTKDGKSWNSINDGKSQEFYTDKSNNTPKDALSDKLDEVLCSRDNVTLDLSYTTSTRNKYCCSRRHQNITVKEGDIMVDNESKIRYYKYTLPVGRLNIAGIKYSDSGHRKRIKINGLPFSSSGSLDIYTFYCDKNNPVLIYVDSTSIMTRGWYRKSRQGGNRLWTRIPKPLKNIKPTEITDCDKWNKLKKYLKAVGCSQMKDCIDPSAGLPQSLSTQDEQIEESDNESSYKPPNATLPGVIINIRQDVPHGTGTTYYGSPNQVHLRRCEDPASSGFVKLTHGPSSGRPGDTFEVKEVRFGYGSKNQEEIKPGEPIKSYSVWYWYRDSRLSTPLLIEVLDEDGTYTYYYNKGGGGTNVVEWSNYLNNTSKLTGEDLETQLDHLNCYLNQAVTINLTFKNSDKYSNDLTNGGGTANTYCCGFHEKEGKGGNVTVTSHSISVGNGASQIPYYEHDISSGGSKLVKIKYYDGGINTNNPRKSITFYEPPFPTYGIKNIYTFYCGENPVLIYVKDGDQKVDRWYKQSIGDKWKRVLLGAPDPDNIKKCGDRGFKELVKELNKIPGCGQYKLCTENLAPSLHHGLAAGEKGDRSSGAEIKAKKVPEGGESLSQESQNIPDRTDPLQVKNVDRYTVDSSQQPVGSSNQLTTQAGDPQPRGGGEPGLVATSLPSGGSASPTGTTQAPSTSASNPVTGAEPAQAHQQAAAPGKGDGPPHVALPQETFSKSGSDSPWIKTTSYVLTGVGVVSGSLTGFGWWLYKRSKGDPWVRQI